MTCKHGWMLTMQLLWNYQYPPITQDKSPSCSASRRCYHCGRHDYHRSLCPSKFKWPSAPSINAAAPALKSQQDTNVLVQDDQAVVLQTAVVHVVVKEADPVRQVPARILFDTGSSRSFVTKALQQRLSLPTTSQDSVALATSGSQTRRTNV